MPALTDEESLLQRTEQASLNPPPRAYSPTSSFFTRVLGTRRAPAHRVSESLDYEPLQNKLYVHQLHERRDGRKKVYGYTGHTLAKFVVTFATGIATGVQYWAPAASGAGVTLVMAYLNGNHIPHLLRPSTLVAKFIGTVASVAAGLPMGPEGPMVHIGACVASTITYVDCKLVRNGKLRSVFGQFRLKRERNVGDSFKVLDDIVSDTDHREFISAGVSAGIAAAFGAPIGGVLYSMEEACSFWSRKVAWRCFIAGTLSTFTIQIMTAGAAHGAIAYSNLVRMEVKDWLMQLPFLLVNFVMAGLLGAAFNSLRMWLWKIRASQTMHIQRILEVVGLLVLVGLCGFFFAWAAGTCIDMPEDWWRHEQVGGVREYGVRFLCGDQQHNDVATLFLSSTHHTIVRLFSMGRLSSVDPTSAGITSSFSPGALALYTLVYLVLMSLGAGLAIPGPPMSVAVALLFVLRRSVISLVVLMVEGTQGIEFLPGIILAVVVANWVAHYIHHDGVYESELERTGNVYMLRDEPPHRLHTLTTQDIMATGVVGFRSIESVSRVLEVLGSTTHNGFPVFVQEEEDLLQDIQQAVTATPGATGAEPQMGVAPQSQQDAALKNHYHDHHPHHQHQQLQHHQQHHQHQYQHQLDGSAQAHPGGVQQVLTHAGAVQGALPWSQYQQQQHQHHQNSSAQAHPGGLPHVQTHAGTAQGTPAWSRSPSSPGTPECQPYLPIPHFHHNGEGLGGVGGLMVDGLSAAGTQGGMHSGSNAGAEGEEFCKHRGLDGRSTNGAAGWGANGGASGAMRSDVNGSMSGGRDSAFGEDGGVLHTAATQAPPTPTTKHIPQIWWNVHSALMHGIVPKRVTQRLEGFVLRSQLLVLLQRRHFCDAQGNPVGRNPCEKYDLELETEMRTFYRRNYTHSRYLSATPAALDKLALRGSSMQEQASGLYLDLRPFMNRAPFTIRTDCSAARAHQVFIRIGLRHLLVVDSAGHVVGIITRKDLDHAAGHGWWRVSAVAEPPRNSGSAAGSGQRAATKVLECQRSSSSSSSRSDAWNGAPSYKFFNPPAALTAVSTLLLLL
ncbi:chloride channel [Dunaliella salina]|uniref:Chloride channel protein n=1 Tax=Dunaliella salina TaxID=3046 RepID=A0ABQ7GPY2_DUNSA|nr:chloride channel [Dunaliella salina]|eukprot:KAF5836603.1 chloride channel [Dunaliella salina]